VAQWARRAPVAARPGPRARPDLQRRPALRPRADTRNETEAARGRVATRRARRARCLHLPSDLARAAREGWATGALRRRVAFVLRRFPRRFQ
jgi:hypothetical protein